MKVKEIIIVEGKNDSLAVKRAVDADTLETNGSEVSEETLKRIELAAKKRGVIIFTDPDYPGTRIRQIISQRLPSCKHAFLNKKYAISANGKKVGIEHASNEAIRDAILTVREEFDAPDILIEWEDLIDAGLVVGPNAKARRQALGEKLQMGYMNGKQLYKRLQMFQITKEEFILAFEEVLQEEQE
ncbi:ribonuclease M5 [Guptibacillus algicola]|uniref:ribonuclease M5 n=1 Tax=Guptibacillus algicola TaxID=225844 RepID=UPI001CD66AB1|nr:ribonuclease M5 [Alkalihalobacillus algicola]MCA0989576.1 ribonuclease M5 [Alkalihalobacillus algicola]